MTEPSRETPTVSADGEPLRALPHGVSLRELTTHVDDRGTLCEILDARWNWCADPIVYSYLFTIRPGIIKGWGMHDNHEDRYVILFGEVEIVLYDARADSPTRGLVSKIVMSEYRRCLLNIPAGIWHANRNLSNRDVVMANYPTQPYDHENPDKYHLPLDNDQIPHKFDKPRGG